jgi:hypothetical protein
MPRSRPSLYELLARLDLLRQLLLLLIQLLFQQGLTQDCKAEFARKRYTLMALSNMVFLLILVNHAT